MLTHDTKEELERQRIWAEVQRLRTEEGAITFEVHAKKGRYNIEHTVLITKDGRIFFPDHGMCNAHALLVEVDLYRNEKRKFFDLRTDACYAFALFMLRSDSKMLDQVPTSGHRGRFKLMSDGLTNETRKWWTPKAFEFIQKVRKVRHDRYFESQPSQDPSVRGVPFIQSVRKRITPIHDANVAAFNVKLNRIEQRLLKSGHEQINRYETF